MVWWILGAYLLVGFSIGYFFTGIGYKHGGAPYHKPWVMIDSRDTAIMVGFITVGWFPMIVWIIVQRLREKN